MIFDFTIMPELLQSANNLLVLEIFHFVHSPLEVSLMQPHHTHSHLLTQLK